MPLKWGQVLKHVRVVLVRVKAMIDVSVGRQLKHLGGPGTVRLAQMSSAPIRSQDITVSGLTGRAGRILENTTINEGQSHRVA